MEQHRQIINNLSWHNDGKFEAELTNGQITKLSFCEPGKGVDSECGKCLNSIDYKYLKSVYDALGELFSFIGEEEKRMGYTYGIDAPPAKIVNLNK